MTRKKTAKAPTLTIHDVMVEAIEQDSNRQEVKEAGIAVSDHLVMIALKYKTNVGTAPNGRKEFKGEPVGFLGACFEQEQWAKSDSAGVHKIDKLPRCWIDAKTVIRKSMAEGISLKGKSLAKLKELNKEATEGSKERAGKGKEQTETASQFQTILNALYALHESLPEAEREQLQSDIVVTHTKYQAMLQAVVPVEPQAPKQAAVVNH